MKVQKANQVLSLDTYLDLYIHHLTAVISAGAELKLALYSIDEEAVDTSAYEAALNSLEEFEATHEIE